MFVPLSDKERHTFFNQNPGCYIPGYTGHCPTLRFHYGAPYGTKTKEILQELRDKKVIKNVQRAPYRQHNEHDKAILQPIERNKRQTSDSNVCYKDKSPKYIIGYTGFVPTLNFRYGKSYGKAADDSMYEFSTKQRRLREQKMESDRLRAQSAPKLTPIRNADEMKYTLRENQEPQTFKERAISADYPPIAGYTGYIPKVKGNEESLSQRYNNVVKRSMTLLKEERENRNYLKSTEKKIKSILKDYEPYDYNRDI